MKKLIVIGLMLILTSCIENADYIGSVRSEFPNSRIYARFNYPTEVIVVDSTGVKMVSMNTAGKIINVESLVER